MTQEEIGELARATEERPQAREAQRALARTVTALVHGEDHVRRAEQAAQVLFGGSFDGVSVADILTVFEDAPSTELDLPAEGMPIVEMLTATKLAPSKSEAMRLVKGGGVYANNARVADERARLTTADAIGGELFILRKGRKDQHIVRVRKT
jgi:tyrosyl-tRNA synthetase